MAEVVDEKCIVNAVVALLATGGSTNHSIHWIAIARAAGILLDWQDLSDMIAVVRFQGPRANGMPELHKLTPYLGILQDRRFRVALVTDGRMSGASGKVPAAIHLSPEALSGGPISKVRDGDLLRLDASNGELTALVPADHWSQRANAIRDSTDSEYGTGRELFAHMRNAVNEAESGTTIFQP